MIGELESKQILALSSQGACAEEISKDLDIELAAVKLVLARNNAGSAVDRDITDEQLASLRQHAYQLALGAEDQSVQARLTMFLIERDKPVDRKPASSISQINQTLILANQQFAELMDRYKTS